MKMSVNEIARQYIDLATLEGETKLNGDYRRGNQLSKKLNRLVKSFENDAEIAQEVISIALKSTSARAQALAGADALRPGVCVEEAETVLTRISKRNDIIGFGSSMTLKIWRGEIPGKTL